MTRPLRINIGGGWYHVTARGNERHAIYRDSRDRVHFLELLGACTDRHQVRIHAYVLMDNHYHLLVETPEPNLSQAIQWLNVSYSVWFNRRHGRSGHLFQGRFKSVVVEGSSWALGLSIYLHLNPVRLLGLGLDKQRRKAQRAGVWRAPTAEEMKRRLEALRSYRWSSYQAYAGYGVKPKWLECERILGRMRGVGRDRVGEYRRQVEDQVREGEAEPPWTQLKAGVVLGAEEFIERVRGLVKGDAREQREIEKLKDRPRFEEVVGGVEIIKGERWEDFRERYGDWGRDLVLWVARRRCGLSLRELGAAAGGIDYVCAGNAISRLDARLKHDKQLKRMAERVLAQL